MRPKVSELKTKIQTLASDNKQLSDENKGLRADLKAREEELVFERRRLAQALETADNAAIGIGAMGRAMHLLSDKFRV